MNYPRTHSWSLHEAFKILNSMFFSCKKKVKLPCKVSSSDVHGIKWVQSKNLEYDSNNTTVLNVLRM